MARRIGLGRGLDALLDNNDDDVIVGNDALTSVEVFTPIEKKAVVAAETKNKSQDIFQLPVDKLVPNPGQPRKNFNETELQELAASIKTYGIIQPVIAANAGDGTYIIIAGERRTRAAVLAGLETVPVIIRDYTDQKQLEVSLIENIQRTDLNPIEEAAAYKNLMDFSGLSQDDLAVRVGKNRSTVANALRLLKLPVEMQKSIEEGKVSSGHARTLLSVTDAKAREKLYREILAGDVSVREAEKRASSTEKKVTKKGGSKQPPEMDAITEKFINTLGTKVAIEGDLNKSRILIGYYSMEDLERLYEILG
jgi:ParB family chromosome partitioning protein